MKQAAPFVQVEFTYTTKYHDTTAWSVNSSWPFNDTISNVGSFPAFETKNDHAVYDWPGDTSVRKRPLHIRTTNFLLKDIGQENPWPAGTNTLRITMALNVDLLKSCLPMLKLYDLNGVCIPASDVALASPNGVDHTMFANSGGDNGRADWDANAAILTLIPNGTAGNNVPPVRSNTNFTFSFSFQNPVVAQDTQPVAGRIWYDICNGVGALREGPQDAGLVDTI